MVVLWDWSCVTVLIHLLGTAYSQSFMSVAVQVQL